MSTALSGSACGAPACSDSGTTPAQVGQARSSSSSLGPPVRTLAEASASDSRSTVVAPISLSVIGRSVAQRPGATRSVKAASAAVLCAASSTISKRP